MKERLEAARKRLAELELVENPDQWVLGSIAYERGRIEQLERMLDPQK